MVLLVLASLLTLFLGFLSKKLMKIFVILLFAYLIVSYKITDEISLYSYVAILIFFSSMIYDLSKEKEYISLMILLLSSILGLLNSKDFINSFIYFEMMCIISYFLVCIEKDPQSIEASLRYIYFGIIGSLLLLWSIYFKYSGNTELFNLFFLLGLCVEMAIFPFYFWLPNAHSEAITPVSAVLSGVVIEASAVFFMKYYRGSFFLPLFSVITMFLASLSSLREQNPKKILAYSSVLNMGFVLLLKGNVFFYYLIFHSVSKALAFLSIGPIVEGVGKDVDRIYGSKYIYSSTFLSISLLSLAGFPPFLGFFAKLFSVIEILKKSFNLAVISLFPMALFTYPYFRIFERILMVKGKNVERFSEKNLSQMFLAGIMLYLSVKGVLLCMSG